MKTKQEITELIVYLESIRNKSVDDFLDFIALAISSQIHLLKWVLNEN